MTRCTLAEELALGQRALIDGTLAGPSGIDYNHGGHAIVEGQGGRVTMRYVRRTTCGPASPVSARPTAIAPLFSGRAPRPIGTDSAPLINRTGKAADTVGQEQIKMEGTRSSISHSVFRNTHYSFVLASAAEWSTFARGGRISHSVFEHGGVLASLEGSAAGARR